MRVPYLTPRSAPPAAFADRVMPIFQSNWISRGLFHWVTPMIAAGYSRPLELDDMWQLPDRWKTADYVARIEQAYYSPNLLRTPNKGGYISLSSMNQDTEIDANNPAPRRPLWQVILYVERARLMGGLVLFLIGHLVRLTIPLITARLIELIQSSYDAPDVPYLDRQQIGLGIALILSTGVMGVLCQFCMVNTMFFTFTGMRQCGSALISLIAKKSLRLSPSARIEMTNGKIVNMSSSDTGRIWLPCVVEFITMIFKTILGSCLLYHLMGLSALLGLAFVAIFLPLVERIMNRIKETEKEHSGRADERLRIIGEVLVSMRAIKAYAYETVFANRVHAIREEEIALLRLNVLRRAFSRMLSSFIPLLASMLSVVIYVKSGHQLQPAKIFAAWQAFEELRSAVGAFPRFVSWIIDGYVALGRIDNFLRAEEYNYKLHIRPQAPLAIQVEADFRYETTEQKSNADEPTDGTRETDHLLFAATDIGEEVITKQPFALRDVNLRISRGELVVVLGRIGTGKSTLIGSLLNEIRRTRGSVIFGGSVAYVPQHAWVASGSIRDNITFHQTAEDIDFTRLAGVIDACGLKEDLQLWPDGILTEIGERGITLSGGQRQRLCLARAAYEESSIVMLDDPLSALDANVGDHVLRQGILSGPFSSRTRILVTHQLDLIQHADRVIVMDHNELGEGHIVQQGHPKQLLAEDGPLKDLMKEESVVAVKDDAKNSKDIKSENDNTQSLEPAAKLMLEEEKRVHEVPISMYGRYFQSARSQLLGGIALLFLGATPIISAMITIFLGIWTERSLQDWSQKWYLSTYIVLGALYAFSQFMGAYCGFLHGQNSSINLFKVVWKRVLHAPMSWHDRTPTGRILNRLSKDVSELDKSVMGDFIDAFNCVFGWIVGVVVMGLSYPRTLFIWIPLCGLAHILLAWARPASRDTGRLVSLTKSRTQGEINEQTHGLSIIRSFGRQREAVDRVNEAADGELRFLIIKDVISRWRAGRSLSLAATLPILIGLAGLFSPQSFSLGVWASVYVYSETAGGRLGSLIVNAMSLELAMNNVERIIEYTELEQEAAYEESVVRHKD